MRRILEDQESTELRIAFVVKGYPPHSIGGTEIATQALARHISNAGHEVHVITRIASRSKNHGNSTESNPIDNLNAPSTPVTSECDVQIHYLEGPDKLLDYYRYYRSLKELIQEINPHIIHAMGLYSESFFAVRCALNSGIRCAVSPRGSDILRASSAARWFIGNQILSKADIVLVQNRFMERESRAISSDITVSYLPNGVDRILDPVKKEPYLLFVGRLHHVKGIDVLLDSMKEVVENHPIQLRIVGDGEMEPLLEKIKEHGLKNNIEFLGAKTGDELNSIISRASALILPSRSEAFPRIVIEAMAAGTPVIATKVGGIPELITDGCEGYLVEPDDPHSLAKAILNMMKDDTMRRTMGENARKQAANYLWDNIVADLINVYKTLNEMKNDDPGTYKEIDFKR